MAHSRLRIMAVFALGMWLPVGGFTQSDRQVEGEVDGGCAKVRALEDSVRLRRKQLALARERYTDNHPMVQAWIEVLSGTESALAARRAKAASAGLDCPASL